MVYISKEEKKREKIIEIIIIIPEAVNICKKGVIYPQLTNKINKGYAKRGKKGDKFK